MKHEQHSIAARVASDRRPVHEWAAGLRRLCGRLYEVDPDLCQQVEKLIDRIASSAADLDCLGHGDATAPPVGAPTQDVLRYLFRIWPEVESELRKLITRADQVLGRSYLLKHLQDDSVRS
jgi:hypothetical protein